MSRAGDGGDRTEDAPALDGAVAFGEHASLAVRSEKHRHLHPRERDGREGITHVRGGQPPGRVVPQPQLAKRVVPPAAAKQGDAPCDMRAESGAKRG